MKKLSEEHYIVVDDSDIKIGDVVAEKLLTGKYELFTIHTLNDIDKSTQKKIAYSTQPESLGTGWMQSVLPLLLSEVKELFGVVDEIEKIVNNDNYTQSFKVGFEHGYNQAIEDNKEKKYTRNEVHALMCKAFEQGLKKADVLEAGLEGKETDVECAWILTRHDSTPKKTEWEVEFVDGKLKLKS